MAIQKFDELFSNTLVPQFCDDPSRNFGDSAFKRDWHDKISDTDATDFLRAFDGELIRHSGRGQYLAARSSAKEQFFSSGSRAVSPRPFYLWVEPIITVAVLARLHFDHDWPKHLLGMQSKCGAFDFMAFGSADTANEYIAGEVKKTLKELEMMITTMIKFGNEPSLAPASREVNSYKKVVALRNRRPPIFWAVGPAASNFAFRMEYGESGSVIFHSRSPDILRY